MESLKLEKGSLLEENAALKREVHALDRKAVGLNFTGKMGPQYPFLPPLQEGLSTQCSKMELVHSENLKLKTSLEAKIAFSEELQTKVQKCVSKIMKFYLSTFSLLLSRCCSWKLLCLSRTMSRIWSYNSSGTKCRL